MGYQISFVWWLCYAIFVICITYTSANCIESSDSSQSSTCPEQIHYDKPYRVVVDEHQRGNADTLIFEPFEIPKQLHANDILIEVKAAGINYIDTYHRTGLYPGVTRIGLEGSGIVTMIGNNVTIYDIGDKVYWFGIQGSYATHIICDQHTLSLNKFSPQIIRIIESSNDPDYIYKIGASIGIQVLTAHYLSHSIKDINSNTSVLVHSGAGGTGNILIQIIKHVLNAKLVLTTVGTESKVSIAKDAGADHVIIGYDHFYEDAMEWSGNEGVDVVFDGVGKTTWKQSLKCVKQRGLIVYFGNASGKIPNMDILELTKQGSVKLIRPSLKHFVRTKKEIMDRFEHIFEWIESGALRIQIGAEFKLRDVRNAQRFLESRSSTNKIILLP